MNENHILVTGFAEVPRGTTLYERNKIIGVSIVVDSSTGIIEDIEFTFVIDLTNRFLCSLIKGYNLSDGLDPLIETIRKKCLLPSQGAIIQAIKSAYTRYIEFQR